MKRFNILILSFLLSILTLNSCVDLDEELHGEFSSQGFFESEEDIITGIRGIVVSITQDRSFWAGGFFLGMLSDEYDVTRDNYRDYRFLLNEYKFTPSDVVGTESEGGYWLGCYQPIQTANQFLEEIAEIDFLEEETLARYEAEAKFFRAVLYYQLIRVFGDVPYYDVLPESTNEAESKERMPAEQIYEKIIEDLKFATEHLPASSEAKCRASAASAYAILSSIHLTLATYNDVYEGAYEYRTIDKQLVDNLSAPYSSHWEAAAEYSLELINNSAKYDLALVDDYQNLYNGTLGDTKEHIYALDFEGSYQGGVAYQDYDGWRGNNNGTRAYRQPKDVGGYGTVSGTFEIFNKFDTGDYRLSVCYDTIVYETEDPPEYINGVFVGEIIESLHYADIEVGPKPYSAKWGRYPGVVSEWPSGIRDSYNIHVIRFGEVYLIAAEALNEIGRTSEAIALVNEIRARARKGSESTTEERLQPEDYPTGLSKEEAFKAIWDERTVELLFEEKRWLDLVRRDSLVSVMSRFVPLRTENALGSNVQEYHKLLPIPQVELDRTTGLVQNKGYN